MSFRQVPVAVALWACVSEEVDRRLSENVILALGLRPDEWRSGEILWLVDAMGEVHAVRHLQRELEKTEFKGQEVRICRVEARFRPTVEVLREP